MERGENMSGDGQDRLSIGIDFSGGTHVKGVVCDADGEVVTQRRQVLAATSEATLLDQLGEFIFELKQTEGDAEAFSGLGVAIPGLLNRQSGQSELWIGFRGLALDAVQKRAVEMSQLPVKLCSHVNACAVGEVACGVARGLRDVVYVEVGHDTGAALFFNGKLVEGTTGMAGAIGFNTLDIDGETTVYSRVSGDSIVRRAQERMYRDRTSSLSRRGIPRNREMILEDIIAMANAGDELARVVIERTGMYLGIGLSHLINLLNPELVVVGGEAVSAGDFLLKPAIQEAEKRTYATAFNNCRIVASRLGVNAGAIGAAMLGA